MFLTKAERDLLVQREGMDKNKQQYVRYKLRRKIKHFYDNELPLLVQHMGILLPAAWLLIAAARPQAATLHAHICHLVRRSNM
ncbi:MAG: hypothetical protein M3270_08345 [Thermoproteota archaeon]|nr:hypothetical protein [Thermoproteota archaeon]